MTGIDFAAFKETQYDILAAELRKHLDMKKSMKFWSRESDPKLYGENPDNYSNPRK